MDTGAPDTIVLDHADCFYTEDTDSPQNRS